MNINKKSSFSTIKKFDKKNKLNILIKYKTDRNSIEREYPKYPIKAKYNPKNILMDSFNLKLNSKEKKKLKNSNYNTIYSYKNTLKNAYKLLNKKLRQYNYSHKKYNIQKANEIIFAKNKRIVSIFKDNLLWNETSDFLKQFYNISESKNLIPNINEYYEYFTLLFPEYGPLEDILYIIKKFIKKKKIAFEKYEYNDEKSILNRDYINVENSLSKKNIENNGKFKFQKIINEEDININNTSKTSKTYSHSKTCLNYNNENNYFQEKEINNLKDLSTIISDFLNNDEKIIDNYKYFSKTKNNFMSDIEEKKIENYFNIYKNKDKNILIKKSKNDKKIEVKNKKSDNFALQKLRLKNIFKIIKYSNKFKKVSIKNFSENLTKKKLLNRNEDKHIKMPKKYIQSINTNTNNNSKKLKTISNNNLSKKNNIKSVPLNSNESNQKIKYKYKKSKNNSISIGKKHLLLLSKPKNSNSNNASKNKTGHRYQLLIDKIFNNTIPNQKYSINQHLKPRNHSDGQKNFYKKPNSLKKKDKQIKEKSDKGKKDTIKNNYIYNYTSTYNNNYKYNKILSLTSLNKTLNEKKNTFNIKKLHIKKTNNCIKNTNPFKIKNNVIKYKNASLDNNKNKHLNDYIFLSLSNRMNSNKKEKIRLNFILNKTNDNNISDSLNKNKKILNSKKNKNQSCIRPINNFNNTIILKKKNKPEKYKLNTYTKDNIKEYNDSHISINDQLFKDKKTYNMNNTIKLISIYNPENKIIKKLNFNCNKKEGNTSRSKTKNNIKKDLKEFNISNLKNKDIINIKNKKLNSLEKDIIKDYTFKSLLLNFKKIK